ncbi:hypothetical protein [Bradyrhizobium sp. USDA 4529]
MHQSHALTIRGDSYRLRAELNSCLISRPPLTTLRRLASDLPVGRRRSFKRHHEPRVGIVREAKGPVPDRV